jgi:predicted nucleotidyltransferase
MHSSTLASDLATAREIVLKHLQSFRVKVYLFGSQARGTADLYSDIDIALLPEETLPAETLAELKEKLEESNILRQVDVVDLSETDEAFCQKVMKEGILWKE